MSKFSLNVSDELEKMIDQACQISGRSRNSACIDWILDGVVRELESYKKAGLIPSPPKGTLLPSQDDDPNGQS